MKEDGRDGKISREMFEVRFSHEATKAYKSTTESVARRLNKCIEDLQKAPFFGPHIKKLRGDLTGSYRYRCGSVRIVYSIAKVQEVIWIEYIRIRGKSYR